MNFLEGRFFSEGDAVAFVSDDDALKIDLKRGPHASPRAGRVTVGIRPEHIRFSPQDGSRNRLNVEVIEHLGFQTLVTGKIDTLPITALMDRAESIRYGMNVSLGVDPEHIHLFDAQTGESLARRG